MLARMWSKGSCALWVGLLANLCNHCGKQHGWASTNLPSVPMGIHEAIEKNEERRLSYTDETCLEAARVKQFKIYA